MKIKSIVEEVLHFIGNIILPPRCVFCDKIVEPDNRSKVCGKCADELSFCSDSLCCVKCGKPIVSFGGKQLCYHCVNEGTPWIRRIVSVFKYENCVRDSVLRYKTGGIKYYADIYAKCMAARVYEEYGEVKFDFLCAAPSHGKRDRLYDFDHGETLGKALAVQLDLEFRDYMFEETRKVKKQSSLGYSERKKNMHESLKVPDGVDLSGKTILVADDICTSRATMSECARALRMANAKAVYGVTFATVLKK